MLSDFQYCIQLMLKNQANIKTHPKKFNDKYHDFHCTAQTFKCYCNQFDTAGCVRKNSTWGECSATAGKQLCIATWERSPIDSLIIVEYFCSNVALLRYSCLQNGVQMLGSEQFPIVKVCCESDYCNGPTRLQSFVDALVTGMRYLYI